VNEEEFLLYVFREMTINLDSVFSPLIITAMYNDVSNFQLDFLEAYASDITHSTCFHDVE